MRSWRNFMKFYSSVLIYHTLLYKNPQLISEVFLYLYIKMS